jgi:hypothetical protein
VERVGGIAPEGGGVAQGFDHLVEFHDRPRPPVRHDQRQRLGVRRTGVNEVHVEPVEGGDELVEAIQRGLACPPVVGLGPVAADVLDPGQRDALAPVVHHLGFRPPGMSQAESQIVQHRIGYVDAKRLDLVTHSRLPSSGRGPALPGPPLA